MRSLLVLLACLALAAPAAAMPLDPVATPARQDLRSPDARDAARPVASPTPAPATGHDVPWALVGGGLGALLLGGVVVRRRAVRLRPA